MSDVKVVVLGCGPAGLTAAHAAASWGPTDIRILSKPRKSYMKGAQYLHAPIPGMGDQAEFSIDYRLVGGSAAQYAAKVYGAARVRPEDTSVAALEGIHPAWDIRAAYDDLWATYGSYVADWSASPRDLSQILFDWNPDIVISSIPAKLICNDESHSFLSGTIWSTDQAFHEIGYNAKGTSHDNVVVCNADRSPAWYRSALIHGWGTTEWPADHRPPLAEDHLWEVVKPISTNCDCFNHRVMRVGRYGSWTKGTLVHEIYDQVTDRLNSLQEGLW